MASKLFFVVALLANSGNSVSSWTCLSPPHQSTPVSNSGVHLRGRRMLTDRDNVRDAVPFANLQVFPKLLTCTSEENQQQRHSAADALLPILTKEKQPMESSEGTHANIFQTSGAILLRGLPIDGPSGMSKLLKDANITTMPYTAGVAIRKEVKPGVLQASIEPSEVNMEPHWEMSYATVFPHVVLFYCHKRSPRVGEGLTPITDGRAVRRDLESLGILQLFSDRGGVLYKFFYPSKSDGRSLFSAFTWEQAFGTEDKQVVEAFLARRQKDFPTLKWSWIKEYVGAPDALSYSFQTGAETDHPHVPGERVWFNQATAMHRSYFHAHASFPALMDTPVPFEGNNTDGACRRYPFDTAFGDGSEIPVDVITTLRQVNWNHTVVFQWEIGDLLILDNLAAGHGRMEYDKAVGDRSIFVSLAQLPL